MAHLGVELIGYLAAILTTASFVPQVVRAARTRHTRDLALGMYVMLTVGIFSWLVYGVLIESWPVILANGVTLGLVATVLLLKLRYK